MAGYLLDGRDPDEFAVCQVESSTVHGNLINERFCGCERFFQFPPSTCKFFAYPIREERSRLHLFSGSSQISPSEMKCACVI